MATPEYEALINELSRKKEQEKAAADARAQGEANRRGLVNQTGTSDIEGSLRGAAVTPIENSYNANIANLLGAQASTEAAQRYGTSEREATQGYNTGENQAQRTFQTGERIGTQNYNTGQNAAERGFTTAERIGSQQYTAGENEATRNYNAQQAEKERQFQDYLDLRNKGWTDDQIRKARADWWKVPVGGIAGTVGGKVAGGIIDDLFNKKT